MRRGARTAAGYVARHIISIGAHADDPAGVVEEVAVGAEASEDNAIDEIQGGALEDGAAGEDAGGVVVSYGILGQLMSGNF